MLLRLEASHDTYSISFKLMQNEGQQSDGNQTALQQAWPSDNGASAWHASCLALSAAQSGMAKATAQDPLEYRRVVTAALVLAMRPWGMMHGAAVRHELAPLAAKGAATREQGGYCGPAADPSHASALLTRLMG
jgi:hypothetical protein